jgi:hypothetical protein
MQINHGCSEGPGYGVEQTLKVRAGRTRSAVSQEYRKFDVCLSQSLQVDRGAPTRLAGAPSLADSWLGVFVGANT